jgi:predicted porin
MYNKKLLVLALSAAFAAPAAYAQRGGGDKGGGEDADSVVVLYGKVYPEMIRQYGTDPTPVGTPVATFAAPPTGVKSIITRSEMESSNSRFGVRGYEKLGGDLKAIWQLETIFLLDSNNSAFAQRDSFVGLQNRWGTMKLGRMDTPFKEYGDDIPFLGVSSGNFVSTSALLRRFGFGTSNAARFHERRVNVVQYESPKIGGLDWKAQWSTDEADTATRKPHVWSFGARYDLGPVSILAGHEIHWDEFGGSNNVPTGMRNLTDVNARSKDKATELSATYKLGRHSFEFDYEWHEWKEFGFAPVTPSTTGRFQQYKNTSWFVQWEARWTDQWRTQIHYVKANAGSCSRLFVVTTVDNCITDGLDGAQISIGAAYYFSRKTYLFLLAQQVKNGKSAMFASGTQTPSTGEDVKQYAVGMHTVF